MLWKNMYIGTWEKFAEGLGKNENLRKRRTMQISRMEMEGIGFGGGRSGPKPRRGELKGGRKK